MANNQRAPRNPQKNKKPATSPPRPSSKPPGFATQKNKINAAYKAGDITKEERASFIEDLQVFAADGKISSAEKGSISEEIGISKSQNKPSTAQPPSTGNEQVEADTPAGIPSDSDVPAANNNNSSSGSSFSTAPASPILPSSPPPPAPPAIPNLPQPTSFPVKQADPDIIMFDEIIDPDFIVESFFEEFGGTELIKISRSDLIFSSKTDLINIKNIEDIQQRFSPKNLIPIKSVQDNFARYGIDLFKRNVFEPYFDNNGNLVIEIGIVRSNEVIDVEILGNGTIDEVDES